MGHTTAIHPKCTSRLVVIAFENSVDAFEMRTALKKLEEKSAIDTDDVVVVTREASGEVKLHQEDSLPVLGAALGSFLGVLAGALLANPITGIAAGLGLGALAGAVTDIGISNEFMQELGSSLKPGTSALFVLVHRSSPDEVLSGLKDFTGKGRVLQTSLTPENEERLRQFLENQPSDPSTNS